MAFRFVAVLVDSERIRPGTVVRHGEIAVVVVRVERCRGPDLLHVGGAVDFPRRFPRLVQRRQKHAGEDGDDRNYHEKLYEGKSVGFPLQALNVNGVFLCFQGELNLSSCLYYT